MCESRPMENSPPSPMFFKVKKTHEVSAPSQNGELAHQKSERKQHSHSQPSPQIHQTQPVQPESQQSHSTSSEAGGSESEGDSLPPSYPDEDPERMRHSKTAAYLLQCTTCFHYMLVLYVFDRFFALCVSLGPGRKQKTPKKFTGEQPSISGTFGLKGKYHRLYKIWM